MTPACDTVSKVEERRLTTLIFGNVVLESQLTGTSLRIYAPDQRSYYMRTTPEAGLLLPLDELRHTITSDHARKLAEVVFKSVAEELEESYAGGVERAQAEFSAWLSEPH